MDFLFPRECLICASRGEFLCQKCKAELPRFRTQKANGIDGVTAIYQYSDERVRSLIEEVKFKFNDSLIKDLWIGDINIPEVDLVVPIPLHWTRQNWRVFNQEEKIAQEVRGQSSEIKVEKILVRQKMTKQQAKLDKKERRLNIRDAFRLNGQWRIDNGKLRGKRILLVDDVYTTGESMREAGRVLKKAGVKSVWGLVLAR